MKLAACAESALFEALFRRVHSGFALGKRFVDCVIQCMRLGVEYYEESNGMLVSVFTSMRFCIWLLDRDER